MGTLKLSNSSGNFIALDAPSSIASDKTFTLPNADGSSGQVIQTNGSGVLSFVDQTTDTGATFTDLTTEDIAGDSSVSFTSIPSTATHIIVRFRNVVMSSNNSWGFQLGSSSGLATSGYNVCTGYWGGSDGGASNTSKFAIYGGASTAFNWSGEFHVRPINGTDYSGFLFAHYNGGGTSRFAHGECNLGATLDRIGIVTDSGSWSTGTVALTYMEP